MKRALVFCSQGLGDGLLFSIISYNLFKNGYAVDTYHPFLSDMQNFFKFTKIKKYPEINQIEKVLDSYDLIIINSDYSKINKAIIALALEKYKNITFELHPSTCKGKGPPIGNWKFDFSKNVSFNLLDFLKKSLNLKNPLLENGISIPKNLTHRKFLKRVVIHPSSKDFEKNLPKKKFLKLFKKLKSLGYSPKFILAKHERSDFKEFLKDAPEFDSLNDIASYIYESGYMLGNDSGIAHLSSNLKIPTLTIFSTKRKERFWRPYFHFSKTVVSLPLINIKGLRLREKYWKKTISVRRILKNFKNLAKESL